MGASYQGESNNMWWGYFIHYMPLVFDTQLNCYKKEEETSGEEIICAILYLKNFDKSMFADLKKRSENNYILKKS